MPQKRQKYPPEFRQQALERLKTCHNVTALARELGIRRKWLYEWRNQARAAVANASGPAQSSVPVEAVREPERDALQQRIADLERLVGQQAAEIDFFKGALRRVKERRQSSGETGGGASTRRSGW